MISSLILTMFLWNLIFGFRRTNSLNCGLVGFSSKESFDEMKIKLLLLYNETRGEDSCGIYLHNTTRNEKPLAERVIKEVGKPSEVLIPMYTFNQTNVFIGHDRKATGATAKTQENAHPFLYTYEGKPPIVGVHNGIVRNHYDMCKAIGETTYTLPVDSMVIFKTLVRYDSVEDYKSILSDLGDPNNSIIFTRDDGALWVFRMEGRPLFYGIDKSTTPEGSMYISSIANSLYAIGCEEESVKSFEPDKLYKIENGKITETHTVTIKKPVSSVVSMTPTVTQRNLNYGYDRAGSTSNSTKNWRHEEAVPVAFSKSILFGDRTGREALISLISKEAGLSRLPEVSLGHTASDDDDGDNDDGESPRDFVETLSRAAELLRTSNLNAPPALEDDDSSPFLNDNNSELTEMQKQEVAVWLSKLAAAVKSEMLSLKLGLKAYTDLPPQIEGNVKNILSLSAKADEMSTFIQTNDTVYKERAEIADF